MGELVHCMICFLRPTGRNKYFIASCGHIFCYPCLTNEPWMNRCKKCGKAARLLEINSSLPPDVKDLFSPIDHIIKNMMKDIGKNIDFQTSHRLRLVKTLQNKNDQFDKLQCFCKNEMKKKEAYKQEMVKLQEFKKKAVVAMQQMKQRELKSRLSTTILASNFQTPVPGKHRSFVTSTPIVNDTMNVTSSDVSMSFSAATGIAQNADDCDVNIIVSGTSNCQISSGINDTAALLSLPQPLAKKRSIEREKASSLRKPGQTVSNFKTPVVKKTKLDVGAKSQPLPFKRI